jgi:hypothetical protein
VGWKNLGEKPVVETPWFRLNWTGRAVHRGDPVAGFEAGRTEWSRWTWPPPLISGGQVPSAVTATVLMPRHHRRPDGDRRRRN